MMFVVTSAAYIQEHSRLDFIMEINSMNPDQNAPLEHKQTREQTKIEPVKLHPCIRNIYSFNIRTLVKSA